MEIKACVRGREAIASGVIHTSANYHIDFLVNGMPIQIRFFEDVYDQTTRYLTSVEGGALIISLYNFGLIVGEGMYDPIPITVVDGKQLFLSFTVATGNRFMGLRTFSYTFFHGQ